MHNTSSTINTHAKQKISDETVSTEIETVKDRMTNSISICEAPILLNHETR